MKQPNFNPFVVDTKKLAQDPLAPPQPGQPDWDYIQATKRLEDIQSLKADSDPGQPRQWFKVKR